MQSNRNYVAAPPAEGQSLQMVTGEHQREPYKKRPGYSLFQPLSNKYLTSKQNRLKEEISNVFDKSLAKIEALIKPGDMTYGFFTEMELKDNVIKMILPVNAVSGWNLIETSFIEIWNKLIPNFIIKVEKPEGNPLQLKKNILLYVNSERFSLLLPKDIQQKAEIAERYLSDTYHTSIKIPKLIAFFQKFESANVKNQPSRDMDDWDPELQPGTNCSGDKLSWK